VEKVSQHVDLKMVANAQELTAENLIAVAEQIVMLKNYKIYKKYKKYKKL
jgi:hypothetical protein